jgi:DNA-binding transcriptional LysR family regulator
MSIESRIKLRHLQLAVAVHESGSVRRASERLNISQPAATKALHDLEHQLGVTLFVRSKAGMIPTSFGDRFVSDARTILNDVRSSANAIQQMKEGDTGEIAVGTLPASAMTIAPRAIALSRKRRPGLHIRLYEGSTGQLVPALQRGEIDLIVGRLPHVSSYERVSQEILCNDPNVIVCRKGHPLDASGPIDPAALLDQEWVLPDEGSYVRADLQRFFEAHGLAPPDPVLVTSSTVVRLTLVMTTDMIAVLTKQAAIANAERGLLAILDVGLVAPRAPIIVATREGGVLTPAAEFFIECLRSAASDPQADSDVVVPGCLAPVLNREPRLHARR